LILFFMLCRTTSRVGAVRLSDCVNRPLAFYLFLKKVALADERTLVSTHKTIHILNTVPWKIVEEKFNL
jgi:hypothetical protein